MRVRPTAEGPDREGRREGKNWTPGGGTARYHEGGKWRVEVISPDGGGPFLSVIQTDRSSKGPPSVSPILDDPVGIGVSVGGRTVIFKRDSVGLSSVR